MNLNKKKRIIIIITLGLIITSLFAFKLFKDHSNKLNKDYISFESSVISVEFSISEMIILMDKLNTTSGSYFFDKEGYLYVNNQKILTTNITSINELSSFKNMQSKDIERFISLASFLKQNNINSAYKDSFYQKYMFAYQYKVIPEYEERRVIVLMEEGESFALSKLERINYLDKKGNLYLISFTKNKNNIKE